MCLSFPVFPNDLQAWGNNLAATAVIAGGLVWHILHPPSDDRATSLLPAAGKLQPGMQNNPVSKGKIENVQRAATSTGSRSHRCRFRQQSRAVVCPAADQIDLGRPGLRRRLQGGRRSSRQGHRDARFFDRGQADRRSSRHRGQEQRQGQRRDGGRMCCSTVTTTCSRSIRSIFGIDRRSSRSLPIMPTDERSSSRAAPRTTRAS